MPYLRGFLAVWKIFLIFFDFVLDIYFVVGIYWHQKQKGTATKFNKRRNRWHNETDAERRKADHNKKTFFLRA